ncbi:CS domain-containing protein [Cryptosporidium serpentis]
MDSTKKSYTNSSGKILFYWDQTLDDVNLFIPHELLYSINSSNILINKFDLDINIGANYLKIINKKINQVIINKNLFSTVDTSDSFWYIEDNQLFIQLSKMRKAEVWTSIFKAEKQLNLLEVETIKKQMMLERFQRENPGFDFSGAEFSGNAPDPRNFLGGPKMQ